MAMLRGHHRGLSTGHVFKGVVRELGRASCLLMREMPEDKGYRQTKSPGAEVQHVRKSASRSRHRCGKQTRGMGIRYRKGAMSEPTGMGKGSLVAADKSVIQRVGIPSCQLLVSDT